MTSYEDLNNKAEKLVEELFTVKYEQSKIDVQKLQELTSLLQEKGFNKLNSWQKLITGLSVICRDEYSHVLCLAATALIKLQEETLANEELVKEIRDLKSKINQ